jgi:hypothetical protein
MEPRCHGRSIKILAMKAALVVFLVAGICLAVICTLLWIPEWMANQYPFSSTNDWAAQVSADRSILVNLLGGTAVALTIYFTYKNFTVAQQNLRVAEENTSIAQQRLVTESLSRSIEQLGDDKMSIRLGGIFTLARIAKESRSEHYSIMEILTGHIRHLYRQPAEQTQACIPSSGPSKCPVDAQAILTIVGDRFWPHPKHERLDLSDVHISDAWLPKADLTDAFFWNVRLRNWNLENANLTNVDFTGSVLEGINFTGATLAGANFDHVSMISPKGLTHQQLDSAINVDPALRAYL